MTESWSVGRRKARVLEAQSYQPFIIDVVGGHTVRAALIAREIVFIALTSIKRVFHAYGARREHVRIEPVDRMVDGHSKIKGRQHGTEFNDEFAVPEKFVGACGVGGTENVGARRRRTFTGACSCPTLGTKQRKRRYKEREYSLEHDRTSSCVAGGEFLTETTRRSGNGRARLIGPARGVPEPLRDHRP